MKPSSLSTLMKATAYLIATAIALPAAIIIGINATIVAATAITVGLAAIALGDYGRNPVNYCSAAAAKAIERHPLAA